MGGAGAGSGALQSVGTSPRCWTLRPPSGPAVLRLPLPLGLLQQLMMHLMLPRRLLVLVLALELMMLVAVAVLVLLAHLEGAGAGATVANVVLSATRRRWHPRLPV